MKRIILLAVAAMMATVSLQAQEERKNEVAIAYGVGSNTDIVSSIYKGIFTGKQSGYWGPLSVECFHHLGGGKLGLGAVLVLGGCKWGDSDKAKTTFYTAMPAVKYNWKNKKMLSMYSKLAAGITIADDSGSSDSSTDSSFNFHLTAFGIEVGSSIRGFAEAGWGEQGILLAGLRYKF